jgi:hypothetical protein
MFQYFVPFYPRHFSILVALRCQLLYWMVSSFIPECHLISLVAVVRERKDSRENLERLEQHGLVKSQTHWPGRSDAQEWSGVTTAMVVEARGYPFGPQGEEHCAIKIGTRKA